MAKVYKSDEEYIFKAEFNEDYGLQFMPTGESIVRCKDCKYSVFEQWVDGLDIYTCGRTSLTMACGDCNPTDFCSWGERKSEVEE